MNKDMEMKLLNEDELDCVAGGAPSRATPEKRLKNYVKDAVDSIRSGRFTYDSLMENIRGHTYVYEKELRGMGVETSVEEFIVMIDELYKKTM